MRIAIIFTGLTLVVGAANSADSVTTHCAIVCPEDAPANVKLAAKEIRRYVYLRTGTLLPIAQFAKAAEGVPDAATAIGLVIDRSLQSEQYRLRTTEAEGRRTLTISGGSDVAVLYGAYCLAEHLGLRFYLHGDAVPDARIAFALPKLDETHQPLFSLRGIQPFHDFPEGPDWWTTDDWKLVVSQSAKMRMNFIGLHTYPFQNKDLGPEPTVWVGLPQDVNADGTVKISDYSSWYNTQKFMPYGCCRPEKTSAFSFGGAEIFPADDYGPAVNGPHDFPFPKTPAANVALIDRTGAMLKTVFDAAHRLGIKTCVGTESPLDIPDVVKARLQKLGMKPDNPATIEKLYEGMFARIQRAYPIDYYWIWGHEGEIDQQRFILNLRCARAALKESNSPFGLGICGWGWITGNFPALDRALPKDIIFSAINMSAGHDPVSPNFGRLAGRQKWSIPWLEDDGGLTSFQLRAGRVRRDAVDARRYGCSGLMGLHWHTRILGPNVAALAQAGWEQGSWRRPAAASGKKADALPRDLPVRDFYEDWSTAQFGPQVGAAAAAMFTELDGKCPSPSVWDRGPGVISVNGQPWATVAPQYAFVNRLAAIRPRVVGAGNMERFDWWLNTFRFTKAMARLGCARGELDAILRRIDKEPDPKIQRRMARQEALQVRVQMVALLGEMYERLLATLNNATELGTVVNIEQQSMLRVGILTGQDAKLKRVLGEPLPPSAQPWKDYRGSARLVVMSPRGSAAKGEALLLGIIALDKRPAKSVSVRFRPLGKGEWTMVPATHVARAVYRAQLPPAMEDFEYNVVAEPASGRQLVWPAAAPEINHTVVVSEP
jgi:hypothetical protein